MGRSAGDVSGAGATRRREDPNGGLAGFLRPPDYATLNKRQYNQDALAGGYYGPSASRGYGWNEQDPWSQTQISHQQTRANPRGTFEGSTAQAPMATQTPVGEYQPDTAFDLQEDRLPDPRWAWLVPPPGGRR
jgi:hypothetical protein